MPGRHGPPGRMRTASEGTLRNGTAMKNKRKRLWIALFLPAVVVNLAAWCSRAFCDFYILHIFPFLGTAYSRVTALLTFSAGEWMLAAAVLFLFSLLIAGLLRIFVRRAWTAAAFHALGRAFCWLFLIFFWIMTCNCFIQYHASAFEEKYMSVRADGYTVEELAALRDYIVENLNEMSGRFARDERGYLVYEGDLHGTAIAEMTRLGGVYDQLGGYYPPPKQIFCSDFLSQTHMMGYYFPFSMEANYNRTMYVVNMPSTVCHELAHLKGFIQEDEASLIGYLACVDSADPFFRYSGYMGVLNYVENEFLRSIGRDAEIYNRHPAISEQVRADNIFLTEEAWEKVEDKAVVSTQTAKKASRAVTTATLKMNGVKEGMQSYEGVVRLLLDHYDGILF